MEFRRTGSLGRRMISYIITCLFVRSTCWNMAHDNVLSTAVVSVL